MARLLASTSRPLMVNNDVLARRDIIVDMAKNAVSVGPHQHPEYVLLSDYEDGDLLAKLLNVDGPASGLDADTIDGEHASAFASSTHGHSEYSPIDHTHTQYAALSHQHSASDLTSGTLGVDRGGTGINSYTSGNYIRAAGASSLEQRTPSQVLSDIGAAALGHNHDSSYVKLADYEDGDVLTKLLNVDGSGSGLDADLLDGQHGSYYAAASNAIDSGTGWTPTITCSGSMTISDITFYMNKHYHLGPLVLIDLVFYCTLGGTASNTLYISLPHTAASSLAQPWTSVFYDGSTYNLAFTFGYDSSSVRLMRYDKSNFVTGTGKRFILQGWYRAA